MTRAAAATAAGPFDAVHAQMLLGFTDLVAELGGDAAGRTIDGGGGYAGIARLLEDAAVSLGCPDFGLRLAERQGGTGMFGPLGEAMRQAASFGDALTYVVSHPYAHSLAARIWQRRLRGGAVFVGHDILLDGIAGRSQLIEQVLLLGHLAAMALSGGHARARRVALRHQPLLPLRAYRRYFGCPVAFGQRADGVLFHEGDMRTPIIGSDSAAYQRAIAAIDTRFTVQRPPLHAEVRGIVTRLMGERECTNERIAAELNLHTRTLLRRLRAEGTSFQQIKDGVRRDLTLYYLEKTDLGLARISEKLGFAEQSVMSRRCREWFAATPSVVRAKARHAA